MHFVMVVLYLLTGSFICYSLRDTIDFITSYYVKNKIVKTAFVIVIDTFLSATWVLSAIPIYLYSMKLKRKADAKDKSV